MTWQPDADFRPETHKCRDRLIHYCQGIGLDIGCGSFKITPKAIGIDRQGAADILCDISKGLDIFAPGFFDYIYSSHCLEDLVDTEGMLREWWSKIKVGGHLILYLPHKDLYPNVGVEGSNIDHVHDFVPQDILSIMDGFAHYQIVRNETHSEDDEYSFDLVLKKLASKLIPINLRKDRDQRPRALVVRYGAFGDHLIASPVPKRLSDDGFHVTYQCTTRALPVIANNPYIDEVLLIEEGLVDPKRLGPYWDRVSKDYDKFVNLSETLEAKFLKVPQRNDGFFDPPAKRRLECGGTNYYDYALEAAGYTDTPRPRPELYPTPIERGIGQMFRRKWEGRFLVLWAMSGSAPHKAYPWAAEVALEFLERHKDAITFTVGDEICRLLEWDHPRAHKKANQWDIRSSMLATQYVDLVIGPETGVVNAAGCYPTPKICMLTHSNKINLTKYYANDLSMQAEIECSPCHRMIYQETFTQYCPLMDLGNEAHFCACGGAFPPEKLYQRMEAVYARWKERNRKVSLIRPEQAVRDFNRIGSWPMVRSERNPLRTQAPA
jgi:ADP-heptose:LPS heptosyltransferase